MAAQKIIDRINSIDKKDFYKVLSLDRSASDTDIKKSYRKLALKLHPDRCKLEGASEAFKVVGSAYSVLSDADKKRQYDQFGAAGVGGGGGGGGNPFGGGGFHGQHIDPEEIFRQVFGQQFGRAGGGMSNMGGVRFSFGGGDGFSNVHSMHFNANDVFGAAFGGNGGSPFVNLNQHARQRQRQPERSVEGDNSSDTPRVAHPWVGRLQMFIRRHPMLFVVGVFFMTWLTWVFFSRMFLPMVLVLMFAPPGTKKYLLTLLAVVSFFMTISEMIRPSQ